MQILHLEWAKALELEGNISNLWSKIGGWLAFDPRAD